MTNTWLTTPSETLRDHLDPALLSPLPEAAAMTQVEREGVTDNGEKLVDVPERFGQFPGYAPFGIESMPPAKKLRTGVVQRLDQALTYLPEGFGLCVLDGWRSPQFQADLLAYYQAKAPKKDFDGFVSDPEHATVVAPHTTGGAVDLTLTWEGQPLGLGTDWDAFSADAAYLYYENSEHEELEAGTTDGTWGSPELARDLRRTLSNALLKAGFAPLASEWWHWSYGEQQWAAFTGENASIYGEVLPE